ncbi:MAG: antibiotic biosynthesis monooxygenase [Armatimonadetes bacterium]|nr:antibiotic biosynthesis monooxygenase [Armatimonadota bacterium]
MYVTLVYVHVKPDHVEDFALASLENAKESRKELGNLRFDILQSTADPCRFILYEAYDTPEAAAAHKHTPHYLKWKEIVADWMAEPRQGVSYTGL